MSTEKIKESEVDQPTNTNIEDDENDLISSSDIVESDVDVNNDDEPENQAVETPLEEKFDRTKLVANYKQLIEKKVLIIRKNNLLNRKVYDHYRKKGIFRAIAEDNISQVLELTKKYRILLEKMDLLIATEERTKINSEEKIKNLNENVNKLTENREKYVFDLNKRIKEFGLSLQSSSSGLFMHEKVIDKLLKRITNTRLIISEERFNFIQTQDRMTEIDNKAKQLEDLGDGLRMIDFEQLRAETQSLSDKIEERNNELLKLRTRCNSDTQILAHIREKEFMLGKDIVQLKITVTEKVEKLAKVREYLNGIKIERDTLRKKYTIMSESCGILDKMNLLKDYDCTVTNISEQNELIENLKKENKDMEDEMLEITIQMDSTAFYKTESQKFDEFIQQEIDDMDKLIYPWIKQGIKPCRSYFK